jgi:hypothetical protein
MKWSARPISSRREDSMAPPPAARLMPDEPAPTAPTTVAGAANLVRNLEAPRFGVDRYIESRLAAGAGTRELDGGSSKGFVYKAGPYKNLTKGQAMERARAEYAGLDDRSRLQYETGAQGRDVMSGREVAQEKQFYAARGVSAMQGAGAAAPGSPAASPMTGGVEKVGPMAQAAPQMQGPPAPNSLGTINGRPVTEIRAERNRAKLAATPAAQPAAPVGESPLQKAAGDYSVMQNRQGPPRSAMNTEAIGRQAYLGAKADYYQGPPKELKMPPRTIAPAVTGEQMMAANTAPTPTPASPLPMPTPAQKASAMGAAATFKGSIDKPSSVNTFGNTDRAIGLPAGTIERSAAGIVAGTKAIPAATTDAITGANSFVRGLPMPAVQMAGDIAASQLSSAKAMGAALGEQLMSGPRQIVKMGEAIGKDLISRPKR